MFSSFNDNMAARSVKLGGHLRELRFHLCLRSPASKGVREFLENSYVALKTNNPKFPFLVREASNVQPKVYARYEYGRESSLPLTNLSKEQVEKAVDSLITKSE